ncbi:hypothetical protein [uncultured Ramlibacter sp.]|uniref:FFLEELY motif protein n=1 Tax=uncultured Ramlibacter sp. TaxID=260755 RepID=UPI0026249E84|nr:hypothetical protein [uncultured Ramlibacter sp.]
MEAARTIREAIASVALLRQAALDSPALGQAVGEIKRLQAARFAGTYADLLASSAYAAPARFFLEELYGDRDYEERDAQFGRIAGTIGKLFPAQAADTAVALARLHALTEDLDQAMAAAWLAGGAQDPATVPRYIAAWRAVGRSAERQAQLAVVVDVGRQLARLTRAPGLRTMLRMMRGPAAAAGMGSLQRFLENGFDTFAAMARQPNGVETFLGSIAQRESSLIANLFDADLVACETQLQHLLGQAR